MPNITPIKAILDGKEDGDKVLCVRGTITAVYPPKTGSGKWGEYTIQNIQIKDETGTIRASLWSQPIIGDNSKNHPITIECRESKDGWTGVNVKQESWTDKKTGQPRSAKTLNVSQMAIVILDGGAPVQQPLPHDRLSGSIPVNDLESAKKFIARNISLYVMCRRAACAVLTKEVTEGPGETVTPETLDAAVASATACVYIECTKAGLQSAMPLNIHFDRRTEVAPPPPPPEPDPEPEHPADPGQNPDNSEVPF